MSKKNEVLMNAIVSALILIFSATVPVFAEKSRPQAPLKQGSGAITIIDGNGEEVTVHKPVKRIIVEYVDNAELLRLLNQQDKIVGVSGYSYIFEQCVLQFPELRKKPSVGMFWLMDYEAILKLNPDLLLSFAFDTTEKRAKLPGVDVVFLGLYYPDLIHPEKSKFIRGVRNLGNILDVPERAQNYIDWHLGLINRITEKTRNLSEDDKPKVLIAGANAPILGTSTYSTYPMKDTLTQACVIAGGKSVAAELPEFAQQGTGIQVDPEWLIAQNPDIMILHAVDRVDLYGYEADDITELRKALKRFMERPELADIKAIKNRRVYIFDGHFRNDASGGVVGAAYMAKMFHPELFEDLDPEAIHQEYLNMQGLDYDLNQHGVFVYPPLETKNGLMGIPDRYQGQDF